MTPMIRHPLSLVAVAMAGVLSFVMTFAYLGAFTDPEGNTNSLPLLLVNEDTGAEQNGQPVNFGQVLQDLTLNSQAETSLVEWQLLNRRDDAVDRLRSNRAFAAVVIPSDYSQRLVDLQASLPAPKQAAEIEVLTNPGSGSIASAVAQQIAMSVATSASREVSRQALDGIIAAGLSIPGESAAIVADPVKLEVTAVQPIGQKAARGLAPFYFAVMLTLAGFIGTNIVNIGVDIAAGRTDLEFAGRRWRADASAISHTALWTVKTGLSALAALLSGLLVAFMALVLLDMYATNPWELAGFAVLGVLAISMVTLALITALGTAGLLAGVLFTTVFGVPSAGGVYPLQMVPPFFRVLGAALPLRYLTDGSRALAFFDGRLSAGLDRALIILVAYTLAALAAGALASWWFDLAARRGQEPAAAHHKN